MSMINTTKMTETSKFTHQLFYEAPSSSKALIRKRSVVRKVSALHST